MDAQADFYSSDFRLTELFLTYQGSIDVQMSGIQIIISTEVDTQTQGENVAPSFKPL